MGKKVYAIKEGYDFKKNVEIRNVIVETWGECERLVKGVKGAKYKSFTSQVEANKYIQGDEGIISKENQEVLWDMTHIYIDGSFDASTGKYSYALAVVKDDVILYIENGSAKDDSEKDIRQIGGELKAAIRALEYCGENNIGEVALFHDYIGVCYHANGVWERREQSSKQYYSSFNNLVNKYNIKVNFVKVESHTGDLYNELVDEFAKYSANVTIKGETEKYLKNKKILVSDLLIKDKFKEIIKVNLLEHILVV